MIGFRNLFEPIEHKKSTHGPIGYRTSTHGPIGYRKSKHGPVSISTCFKFCNQENVKSSYGHPGTPCTYIPHLLSNFLMRVRSWSFDQRTVDLRVEYNVSRRQLTTWNEILQLPGSWSSRSYVLSRIRSRMVYLKHEREKRREKREREREHRIVRAKRASGVYRAQFFTGTSQSRDSASRELGNGLHSRRETERGASEKNGLTLTRLFATFPGWIFSLVSSLGLFYRITERCIELSSSRVPAIYIGAGLVNTRTNKSKLRYDVKWSYIFLSGARDPREVY